MYECYRDTILESEMNSPESIAALQHLTEILLNTESRVPELTFKRFVLTPWSSDFGSSDDVASLFLSEIIPDIWEFESFCRHQV
jgi:hypothetical protein